MDTVNEFFCEKNAIEERDVAFAVLVLNSFVEAELSRLELFGFTSQ